MQRRLLFPSQVRLFALFFLLLSASVAMFAQAEATLYRFKAQTDGDNPLAGLVADSSGNLYGTASDNSRGGGTIFEMSPPASGGSWTYTVLYTLDYVPDGALPWAALLRDSSGNLYGTTAEGGSASCGTVFELSPPSVSGSPWTFNVLYTFAGGTDGCYSAASLIMDSLGNLYGTTETGGNNTGASNLGTVFELSPPAGGSGAWTETVLYRFGSSRKNDASVPAAAVVLGAHGFLYGTTFYGGASNVGTVFALQPPSAPGAPWIEHILYTFNNEGSNPASSLISDGHGNFYGTTADGPENEGQCNGTYCGRIFEISPPTTAGDPWIYSTIWAFSGSDGSGLYDAVTRDRSGNLYGTAAFGGSAGGGTVFKLTPPSTAGNPWTETTLYDFAYGGAGGSRPWGNVVFGNGGRLFGTTFTDGIQNCSHSFGDGGCGTVFQVQP